MYSLPDRSIGTSKHRGEDDDKLTVTDREWERFDWIILARDTYTWQAVVNTVMSIRVASNTGVFN